MNQITELPEPTDAGLNFDYSVWTADTEITLCNVPWDNTNRDILSKSALKNIDAYIDSLTGNDFYPNVVPVRVNEPISIPKPYNVSARYNYLRAVHKAKPVEGGDIPTTYYYFITGFMEDSPNSTKVILQLDVWATYGQSVKIKSAFVERGHIGIANSSQMHSGGARYLTVPEGLDIGNRYYTRMHADYQLFNLNNAVVLVCSNVALEKPWFDSEGFAIKKSARGGTFSRLPTGPSFYVFQNADAFGDFMDEVSAAPHIAQGIMSITLIPEFSTFWPSFNWQPGLNKAPAGKPRTSILDLMDDWRDKIKATLPAKYRHLNKLLTSPYTMFELTSFSGVPLSFKPELWRSEAVRVVVMCGLMPPNQRVVVMPERYNGDTGIGSDYLDTALTLSNFPSLPMVNDAGALYLAQNGRSIAQQVESAEWSRDKATRSNQVSYDQASNAMAAGTASMEQGNNNARAMQEINGRYAWGEAAFDAVSGVGQGAIGGAVGGPAGAGLGAGMAAVSGAVKAGGTAFGLAKQGEQVAQGIANNRAQNDISTASAAYMRDTNAELASFAANGDYENQVAGIMAKTQDAKVSPNSVVGTFGGESFNLINDVPAIVWRAKMMDDAHIQKIGDYWLRYGYAIEMYVTNMPDSLMVMSHFTYWKLTETYINAAPMPELFKQAIRGIFEKGVTVWNDPDMIGSFSTNEPLTGVRI